MTDAQTLHATCVAWDGQAAVIMGKSGAGKSALGLTLMGLGCALVADDRVWLSAQDGTLLARSPDTITGLIEVRGIGILNAHAELQARVALAIDLDQEERERLPQRHVFTLLGCNVPLIYRIEAPHFASAILQILKAGWSDR